MSRVPAGSGSSGTSAPPAGLRWFRAGRSRSFLERACHADRLVLGSSGSSRHWSHSALVSSDSARAGPLVSLRSSGRATGLRWFSSGRATGLAPQLGSGHWSPLVQLGPGHWSRSAARATGLVSPAGLRWLVFAVCACRTPQSPGRSPAGLARSSLPLTSSVPLGPPARVNSTGIRLLSSVPHLWSSSFDCPARQVKKTKVRPDYSSAPTQLALCLRLAY